MDITSVANDNPEGLDTIQQIVWSRNCDMNAELVKGHELQNKMQDMAIKIEDLNTSITCEIRPQLSDSTGQLHQLTAELAETNQLLQLVEQLLRLGEQLAECQRLQADGQLSAAAGLVTQLRQHVQEVASDTGSQLDLVSSLQQRTRVQEEALLHALDKRFGGAFVWDGAAGALTVGTAELADTLSALARLGRLERHLRTLADGPLEALLTALLAGGALQVREDAAAVVVSVRPRPTSAEAAQDDASDPPGDAESPVAAAAHIEAIYAGVTQLLTTLRQAALPTDLLPQLGQLAAPQLAQRLLQGPLAAAVPSSLQQRPHFDAVIEATEAFSETLTSLAFWSGGGSLLHHVWDIDRLMVDRLCGDRLDRARQLVALPLYLTVSVGTEAPAADGTTCSSPFVLPRCRVSDSAVQFADLVETTVEEAAAGPELLSARLSYTARHMLDLYCALLPVLHGRSLEQLPQQAAIAHNNVQLLAHRVITLAPRLRRSSETLLDVVPQLREVGGDIFLASMNRMRYQLLDILSEAGLDQLGGSADVSAQVGAALRQCMHQLRHLSSVWSPVLPAAVQARAIGRLLSVVIGELTSRLLAQQDISASAATQLCAAAAHLVTDAPRLFMADGADEDGEERQPQPPQPDAESRALLARHTPDWARFCELLIVLEENLRGILDRWADGKGPLAQHFTAQEARHLVRALFQNNDRRAAALAQIQ